MSLKKAALIIWFLFWLWPTLGWFNDSPWENYYQTYDSSIWYCPIGVGNLYADKYYFTTGEAPPDTYMEKINQGCYHSAPRVLRKDFTNYYLLPMAGSFLLIFLFGNIFNRSSENRKQKEFTK